MIGIMPALLTNVRDQFKAYLESQSSHRTGKAASYVRALDLLSQMLLADPKGFSDCQNIWSVHSVRRLQELYSIAKEQQRLGSKSTWNLENRPPSYLGDGYCSAALRQFQNFLIENSHLQKLLETFNTHRGSDDELAKKLNRELSYPQALLEDTNSQEGREALRLMKTRVNQAAFREIISRAYRNTCCITGIDLPQVNRASHIIPWSVSKPTRMDPRNGLCLSATYDAAFDRCLISLDEDFRLLVARDIRDHYDSAAVKTHFLAKQGQRIKLPKRFQPRSDYLEKHRNRGRF